MKYPAALLCLIAPAAMAANDDPTPRVCATRLSTASVDLGHYFGVYEVTKPDGTVLAPGKWQACPPPKPGPPRPWESCNFSLCHLPEGDWQVRFSSLPAAAYLSFNIDKRGIIHTGASDFLQQVGNYGIDATGFFHRVTFDLQGYTLGWNVDLWPGPEFQGKQTNGRGTVFEDQVVLSLYPHTPYAIRFGKNVATTLTVNKHGAPESVTPGGALRAEGGVVKLRVTSIRVTPPSANWQLEGTTMLGPQDLILPAGATYRLHGADGQSAELSLDGSCTPSLTGAGFQAALAPGAKPKVTCQ
jgi:hypothetical protein